jgi:hypothetical protein
MHIVTAARKNSHISKQVNFRRVIINRIPCLVYNESNVWFVMDAEFQTQISIQIKILSTALRFRLCTRALDKTSGSL